MTVGARAAKRARLQREKQAAEEDRKAAEEKEQAEKQEKAKEAATAAAAEEEEEEEEGGEGEEGEQVAVRRGSERSTPDSAPKKATQKATKKATKNAARKIKNAMPTTKAAAGGHDEPLSEAAILEQGLLTAQQWRTVSEAALALQSALRGRVARRELFLAEWAQVEYEQQREARYAEVAEAAEMRRFAAELKAQKRATLVQKNQQLLGSTLQHGGGGLLHLAPAVRRFDQRGRGHGGPGGGAAGDVASEAELRAVGALQAALRGAAARRDLFLSEWAALQQDEER